MVLPTASRICAERKEYYQPCQENARVNHSLISTLAIATVAMIGLTLAMHFGAFTVNPAGLTTCSVVTGVVGLGLITAIASRCIGFPKSTQAEPDGEKHFEACIKETSDATSACRRPVCVFSAYTVMPNGISVKIQLTDRSAEFALIRVDSIDNYQFFIDTQALVFDESDTVIYHIVYGFNEELDRSDPHPQTWALETSPHLEKLFDVDQRKKFPFGALIRLGS